MYKLLLADEDLDFTKLISDIVKENLSEFVVSGTVDDGEKAINFIKKYKVDVIITGIQMQRKNGIELLKDIRNKYRMNTPVLFISKYSKFEYAKQGILYNLFDYIVKPINKNEFLDSMKRLKILLKSTYDKETDDFKCSRLILSKDDVNNIIEAVFDKDKDIKEICRKVFENILLTLSNNNYRIANIIENLVDIIYEVIYKNYGQFISIENLLCRTRFSVDSKNINKIYENFVGEMNKISYHASGLHLSRNENILNRICKYVTNNLHKKISLDEIAKELNYSPNYIGKIFRKRGGENFSKYVTRIKMNYAKSLIKSGTYKVYEVSQKFGYKDVDYFSRLFKNYFGLSPSKYKNTI